MSEISSISKVILVLGKARSHMALNLWCSRAESPGWFDVSPKYSAWDMMHERTYCCEEAANHQLPIAAAFWIIPIVSMEECSSLTQNLMQICCSTCSAIWMHSHTVHLLTQRCLLLPVTSTVKSSLFTHAHSSPLSLAASLYQCCANCSHYINNGWAFSRQTSYIQYYMSYVHTPPYILTLIEVQFTCFKIHTF